MYSCDLCDVNKRLKELECLRLYRSSIIILLGVVILILMIIIGEYQLDVEYNNVDVPFEPEVPEYPSHIMVRVLQGSESGTTEQVAPETVGAPDSQPQPVAAHIASGNDHVPAIEAGFDLPVLDYVQYVRQHAGARLIVIDRTTGRPVGEVRDQRFHPGVRLGPDMSLRARNITRDLPADYRSGLLKQVVANGSHGPWRFLLVFPQDRQQTFERALATLLRHRGIDWAAVGKLRIRYQTGEEGLQALVQQAYIDGAPVTVGTSTRLW